MLINVIVPVHISFLDHLTVILLPCHWREHSDLNSADREHPLLDLQFLFQFPLGTRCKPQNPAWPLVESVFKQVPKPSTHRLPSLHNDYGLDASSLNNQAILRLYHAKWLQGCFTSNAVVQTQPLCWESKETSAAIRLLPRKQGLLQFQIL